MPGLTYSKEPTAGLVTIVIPAYRADDYIGEALRSIARQTYVDWELIVVEDASQGKTKEIVQEFAAAHPGHRVVYLRNEKNSGPSHSRNVAFWQAEGEFVALLDADDRWLESHLAACVDHLRSFSVDLAYSTVVMIEDGTEHILGTWGPQKWELDEFPHALFKRNTITPSATVMRRSVIADVGLWATDLRLCEDLDFWLRSWRSGKRFGYVGGCHCLYRQNRAEAATKNKCAVQEAFARVVEQHLGLPGTRNSTCRNRVSRAFGRSAAMHLKGKRDLDPSCNPRQASALLMKAWQLRPKRIDYLGRAVWHAFLNLFRKPPAPPVSSPSKPVSTPLAERRKAA